MCACILLYTLSRAASPPPAEGYTAGGGGITGYQHIEGHKLCYSAALNVDIGTQSQSQKQVHSENISDSINYSKCKFS